jgi:hypothetical protein
MPIPVQCRYQSDPRLKWKKGAVMKTDLVLTIDEYLGECCVASKHVRPPVPDARHVAITTKNNVDSEAASPGCRCDSWGHPCSDCREHNLETVRNFPQ